MIRLLSIQLPKVDDCLRHDDLRIDNGEAASESHACERHTQTAMLLQIADTLEGGSNPSLGYAGFSETSDGNVSADVQDIASRIFP